MHLLRLLIDSLFDARRRAHYTPLILDDVFKPLVALLIVLLCGPEVFAAIELTTLLELLGATLFLFAFATSFKLLALSMLDWLGRALLPLEYRALMRVGPGAALVGLPLIVFNAFVWFILCLTPYMILSKLLGSA
jgi:hypothetical protein